MTELKDMPWLPIEQYFKDVPSGRVLLGWDRRNKRMPTMALGYYDFISNEWRHGVTSIGDTKDAYREPTHYMLLPDDPT
jgi:hypothetical protein